MNQQKWKKTNEEILITDLIRGIVQRNPMTIGEVVDCLFEEPYCIGEQLGYSNAIQIITNAMQELTRQNFIEPVFYADTYNMSSVIRWKNTSK